MKKGFFSEKVVQWYGEHHRDLPWRNTQEPYKIWLSEIILQQTRVIQGLPYYKKFIKHYPKINSLAQAKPEEVLRLWQGLGYYTRARNLHKCAQEVVKKFNGKFPPGFKELRKLPGIGDYTAAAIASFAFQEPVAVVDGNVYRVLSRVFGIHYDITSGEGKRYFFDLANQLISKQDPGLFNQAIMEFGALQCLPQNPKCDECIFKKNCFAFQHDQQSQFPVKRKTIKVTQRYFYYYLIRSGKKILMTLRDQKDIWQGLYDFPLMEEIHSTSKGKIMDQMLAKTGLSSSFASQNVIYKDYRHILTHQIIHARFIRFDWQQKNKLPAGSPFAKSKWYSPRQIAQLPKPVLISRYLEDELIL